MRFSRINPALLSTTHLLVLSLFLCTHHAHAQQETLTPDTVRQIVDEALADAATRTSLFNAEAGLGPNRRFFFASSDGNFLLSPSAEVQFRYRATFDADNDNQGFQMHRVRLHFRGHALTPKLQYMLHVNYNPSSGDFQLEDAFAHYTTDSNLSIRAGQFKLPFDRENFATSPSQYLALDLSILATVFGLSRAPGLQLGYQTDDWRINAALSNGRRAANTEFDDDTVADIALSMRTEFRFGDAPWRQFTDMSAFPGDKFGMLFGLGAHWQQGDASNTMPGSDGFTNMLTYTADIGIENDGWHLLAVFIGQTIESNAPSFTDLGFMVQGSKFIHDQAELFARYAHIFPDSDRSGGNDPFAAITTGFNWYFIPHSHIIKLTAEITYFPDTQANSASLLRAPNAVIGLLPDDSAGQFALGLQLQFMF